MRLSIVAADTAVARDARDRLAERYRPVAPEDADVIVALGGDGFLLATLHQTIGHQTIGHQASARGTPVFGMNRGSVGFLLNDYREDDLAARIAAASRVQLHPLAMEVTTAAGAQAPAPAT